MSKAKRIGVIAGVAALALVASARGHAAAEPAGMPATTIGQPAGVPAPREAAKDNPLGLQPVDVRTLAAGRGGADVFNDMQLKGVVADNQAINVSTGHNAITGGAFANASGVPMVVQNSGNNVLIQNATIINLQMK